MLGLQELFPNVNRLIDNFCFIHSLHHDNEDHFTAKNMIFTGSGREARPPLGSWLAYGLGTENENLPAFIGIMPGAPKGASTLSSHRNMAAPPSAGQI